jgi:hypothetical protein
MGSEDVRRYGQLVLSLLLLLSLTAVIGQIWTHPRTTQWDFSIYYHAVLAREAGKNPYETEDLQELGHSFDRSFRYPPIVLGVLRPVVSLPYVSAARVWLLLKLALVGAVVLLWKRVFVPRCSLLLLLWLTMFAFNAALIWDLRSGNISVLEQLLLWAGLACYLRGRLALFVLFVVFAAVFKLTLIAFLLLLVWHPERPLSRLLLSLGGVLVFIMLILLPIFSSPELGRQFLGSMDLFDTTTRSNPTAYSVFRMIYGYISGADPEHRLVFSFGLVYTALILTFSFKTLLFLRRHVDLLPFICGFCVVFALIMPRFIAYSYLLLVVPAIVLWFPLARNLGAAVVLAGLMAVQGLQMLPPVEFGEVLTTHFAYFLVLTLWILTIAVTRAGIGWLDWDAERS